MIAINNLTYEIGARALYDQADWHIKPGEKIGLIGANGTGKTTLLKLLAGEITPSAGTISGSKDLKTGYLNQDMLSVQSDQPILHVAMEAFERQNQLHDEIEGLLKKIETDHSEHLLVRLSDRQHEFELLDGYNIQYKAEDILGGLGFSAADCSRPLQEFSGGWRMRVMLAKILLQEPDLLLLDEPTNHLDLPSIQWLEGYLQKFNGAYIIVSHDRYFLDRTAEKIVETRGGKLIEYAGNYAFYLEERAVREEIQRNQFKNQQQHIKKEKQLIDRFRAKASKAKMVQSRIKALERMERVEDVDGDGPVMDFRFSFSRPSGKVVAELKNISKAYPGISLLEGAAATIARGDKIGLIGANGRGKSTLLRIVAGTEPCEGEVVQGYNVLPAFFAQHQLESLHLDKTLLKELQDYAPDKKESELRSLLGCFLFSGDDVFKKIRVLSGGEKSRVALARTLTAEANFLLLDEPTNHLDMQSVNILIQALQQYQGSFLLVSHDRHLVQQTANKIWYIEDRQIKEYPGTYQEYEYWYNRQPRPAAGAANEQPGTGAADKPAKTGNRPATSRNDRKPGSPDGELRKLNRQLEETETAIATLESDKTETEARLASEKIYSDQQKLKETNEHYTRIKTKLGQLNREWDELAEQITNLKMS